MTNGNSAARLIDSPVARLGGQGGPSLYNVVRHAIDSARSQGLGEILQYKSAVRAVMRIEPDLPMLVAARLINSLLEELDGKDDLARFTSVIVHGGCDTMSDG